MKQILIVLILFVLTVQMDWVKPYYYYAVGKICSSDYRLSCTQYNNTKGKLQLPERCVCILNENKSTSKKSDDENKTTKDTTSTESQPLSNNENIQCQEGLKKVCKSYLRKHLKGYKRKETCFCLKN